MKEKDSQCSSSGQEIHPRLCDKALQALQCIVSFLVIYLCVTVCADSWL